MTRSKLESIIALLKDLRRKYGGALNAAWRSELDNLIIEFEQCRDSGKTPGRALAKKALAFIAKLLTVLAVKGIITATWESLKG